MEFGQGCEQGHSGPFEEELQRQVHCLRLCRHYYYVQELKVFAQELKVFVQAPMAFLPAL